MVLGMLEVLVELVVLEELVVIVGGIFERVNPQTFFGETIETEKKFLDARNLKILKTKSKIHVDFRVLHSIIPL